MDRVIVENGEIHRVKFTYNTALMIRAYLGLYRATRNEQYLQRARRCSSGADSFLDRNTNLYQDPPKFSHLMIEADLQMYRATADDQLLGRAIRNADAQYESWKRNRPDTLIDNASIARTLWLMADTQSDRKSVVE